MRSRLALAFTGALLAAMFLVMTAPAAPVAAQGSRLIASSGTTSIHGTAIGSDAVANPELRPGFEEDDEGDVQVDRPRPGFKNGKFPKNPLDAPTVSSSAVAASNPELALSLQGLNGRDQRLANGGNQFSLEPPDQALCVGNGYTVEATNSVLRVFSSASGAALTGVMDLNTFFGYPAAINRATFPAPNSIGPNVIDPICLYDPGITRFVVALTTLHVDENGDANGKNTMDVAVSNTGDPTGAWTVYHVPVQNDGTDGTPNHGCTLDGAAPGPCFQDYPHIGADARGVYVSTNEYDLFGPGYNAAQIFAFSKRELAAHGTIRVTLVEDLHVAGTPGFTVWPATSPRGETSAERQGTEYFLSTIAGDGSETGNPTGTARKIGVWALTNTASLDSSTPRLGLSSRLINSETYVFPPVSDQRPGPFPLGECINDTTIPTPFGDGCWNLLFTEEPAHDEVISSPDSLDTRMQQTWYVNGQLWGSAGTAVRVGGELKAGVAWFRVDPRVDRRGAVSASVTRQGYLAVAGNNLTMPAIALTPNGRGAIAFTLLGEDHHPTAAYARITDRGSVGPIRIAAAGQGVADGFTSYKAFGEPGEPVRTRWGDYGAAVTDGNAIWLGSEYIAASCTLDEYLTEPIGSCGGTRTALANWATRLTRLGT